MNPAVHAVADPGAEADLAIGDLAERTGVAAATLRVWEVRYGFPVPQRRASGHRRYTERDAERVAEVVLRRDAGTRLDVAIEQVLGGERVGVPAQAAALPSGSVFAQLRRTHPALMPHRLKKSTLSALSWAIEDEFCARGQRAHLFAAFQKEQHYESAQHRWIELARVSASAFVFADFETTIGTQPRKVALDTASPMRREWSVVCDSESLPVALAAWELPGQYRARDADRMFESIWTVDPTAVREAARVCAAVAAAAHAQDAEQVAEELRAAPRAGATDPAAVTSLFNRVIAYVDLPPPPLIRADPR